MNYYNNITCKKEISGGIGFIGLLQIAFIILKLCNVISWHWVLVCLPLIISISLNILLLLIYFIFLITNIIKDERRN